MLHLAGTAALPRDPQHSPVRIGLPGHMAPLSSVGAPPTDRSIRDRLPLDSALRTTHRAAPEALPVAGGASRLARAGASITSPRASRSSARGVSASETDAADVIRRVTHAASRHHDDLLRVLRAHDPAGTGVVGLDRFQEAMLRSAVYASVADLRRAVGPYMAAGGDAVHYLRFLAQFAPVRRVPAAAPAVSPVSPARTATLPDGVGGDSPARAVSTPDSPRQGVRRFTADAFPPWSEQSPYAAQHTVSAQRALEELRAKLPLHFRSLQDAFMAFDVTGRGGIRRQDLERALARFNLLLSPPEMDTLFAYVDIDRDGAVSFKEWQVSFGKAMQPAEGLGVGFAIGQEHDDRLRQRGLTAKPTDAEAIVLPELLRRLRASFSSVRDAFAALDSNGDGFLDRSEFRRVVERHGMSVGDEVIERLMAHFDADGNGKLDYAEFLAWFKSSAHDAALPPASLPRVTHSPRQRRLVDNSTAALRRRVAPRPADSNAVLLLDSPRLRDPPQPFVPPAPQPVVPPSPPRAQAAQSAKDNPPRLQTPPSARDSAGPVTTATAEALARVLARVDVDGTGRVTPAEVRSALARLGVRRPLAHVCRVLCGVGWAGNGGTAKGAEAGADDPVRIGDAVSRFHLLVSAPQRAPIPDTQRVLASPMQRAPAPKRGRRALPQATGRVSDVDPALVAFVAGRWKALRRAFALIDGARRNTVTSSDFVRTLMRAGAAQQGVLPVAIRRAAAVFSSGPTVRYNDFIAGCLRAK